MNLNFEMRFLKLTNLISKFKFINNAEFGNVTIYRKDLSRVL